MKPNPTKPNLDPLRSAILAAVLAEYALALRPPRDELDRDQRALFLGATVDRVLRYYEAPHDATAVRGFAEEIARVGAFPAWHVAEAALHQEARERGVALAVTTDQDALRLAHEARVLRGLALATPSEQVRAGPEAARLLALADASPHAETHADRTRRQDGALRDRLEAHAAESDRAVADAGEKYARLRREPAPRRA